jgi:hypothetical protein
MAHTIRVRPGATARLLFGVVATLVLCAVPAPIFRHAYGHDYVHGFVPFAETWFDLDREMTVPTWFSSVTLLLCAVLLILIGTVRRAQHAPYVRHWLALGGIFAFMSLDETAEIHESLSRPLRALLDTDGALYYAWVIPGTILVLVLGLAYQGFLRALPARSRALFIAAGALYVGGALGIEFVEASLRDITPRTPLVGIAASHAQEALEMTGIALFVHALLDYLRTHVGTVRLSFADAPSSAAPTKDPPAPAERGHGLAV